MALINCPECGSCISDYATSCPHCGFPVSNTVINSNPDFEIENGILNQFYGEGVVEIPRGVTAINKCVFLNNQEITEVIIPDTVEIIGMSAFSNCKKLKNITIKGNRLKIIDNGAFWGCAIKKINIPNSVTDIRDEAFATCDLEGDLFIPEGTIKIGKEAFKFCENLKNVFLPKSLRVLEIDAFLMCENAILHISDSTNKIHTAVDFINVLNSMKNHSICGICANYPISCPEIPPEEIDKYEYYGTHRFCKDLYNAIIYDTSVCEYFILDNNKFMAEKLKIDDQKNR